MPDTLEVRMFAGDSIIDTSRFYLSQLERIGRQRKEDVKNAKFTSSNSAGALNLKQDLRLMFAVPLTTIDTGRMLLKSALDSIHPSVSFDNQIQRSVTVHHSWAPGESYSLIMDDSAFIDQRGFVNDSLKISFKVRTQEDYGLFILNLDIPEGSGQYIIQLMDSKEVLLRENIATRSGLVRFEYLLPGDYKIKAIQDLNLNGKWDPGNYTKDLLPEKVQYYPSAISIRANWDLQEDWQLNSK
jgi:hypothetical protein